MKVCPIKAPSFGQYRKDLLEDIAILTGGTVISSELGYEFKDVNMQMIGRCASVKVDNEIKGETKMSKRKNIAASKRTVLSISTTKIPSS
mgnify:CR=1 FL=1